MLLDSCSMDSSSENDEIAKGLLCAAAQLQRFSAFVLGLELDYVTPDIQGLTGWVAAARPPCKQPVFLHFRAPHKPGSATFAARQPEPEPSAPVPMSDASLEQYLDEIPAAIALEDEMQQNKPQAATAAAAAAGPRGWSSWACRRPGTGSPQQYPDHPNLAVLLDPARDAEALLSGGLIGAQMTNAVPPLSSPSLPGPLLAEFGEVGAVGVAWHPGGSLADCLRCPATAARFGLRYGSGGGGSSGGPAGDQHLRFLLLQLVAAVCHVHALGYGMGNIGPATVLLQPGGWMQLLPPRSWAQLEVGLGPRLASPLGPRRALLPGGDPDRGRHSTVLAGSAWQAEDEGQGKRRVGSNGTGNKGAVGCSASDDAVFADDSAAAGRIAAAWAQARGAEGFMEATAFRPPPSKPSMAAPPPPPPPLPQLPPCLRPPTLPALTRAWQNHELSNLDYLMLLNLLAGRRLGDRTFHPFVPWVTDFTVPPRIMLAAGAGGRGSGSGGGGGGGVGAGSGSCSGSGGGGAGSGGWHDLTQSRYRQAKGDMQLDVTFATSDVPHHIPQEPLSELSYCIYMARATPRAVLQRAVRSHFEPREYPSSVEAMLAHSPDECLPQLYAEPQAFRSIHPELPDLELPKWAESPEDFIRWHRALLESEAVSQQLHHWLDLFFGYKLVGPAAVAAKNVYLPAQPPPASQVASVAGSGIPTFAALSAAAVAGGESRAPAPAASYAPLGMHAPLFLTPHPPRLARRTTGPRADARVGGSRMCCIPDAVQLDAEAALAVGAEAAMAEGYAVGAAAASMSESVVAPLDSFELLGAVACRDGGLDMHLPYEHQDQRLRCHQSHRQQQQQLQPNGLSGGRTVWLPYTQALDRGPTGRRQPGRDATSRGWFAGLFPAGAAHAPALASTEAEAPLCRPKDDGLPAAREPRWEHERYDAEGAVWGKDEEDEVEEEEQVRAAQGTGRGLWWASGGEPGRAPATAAATGRRRSDVGVGGCRGEEARCGRVGQLWDGSAGGILSASGGAGSLWGLMRHDRQAIGQIAVQVYLGRSCCGPSQHVAYWLRLARRLPGAARRFVRLCFDPQVTAERLLSDPFFGPELHAAHALLRTTLYNNSRPPPAPLCTTLAACVHLRRGDLVAEGPGVAPLSCPAVPLTAAIAAPPPPPLPPPLLLSQQLSMLAAAVLCGRLDEVAEQRPALELCLPHIMHVLWQVAAVWSALPALAALGSSDGGGGSGGSSGSDAQASPSRMAAYVYDILQALLRLLPPDKVTAYVLPYVCSCLSVFAEDPCDEAPAATMDGRPRRDKSMTLLHRMLSPALQLQLLQSSDLDLYVQKTLPLLLAALLCTDGGPFQPDHPPPQAATPNAAPASSAATPAAPAAAIVVGSDGGGSDAGGGGGSALVGGVSRALAVASISDTAASSLLALANRLPLPLVLERLLSPMLSSLTVSPNVPRLVVQLCAELGAQLTARHVAPALLCMAVVQAPPPPPVPSPLTLGGRGAAAGPRGSTRQQHSPRSSKGGGTATSSSAVSYQRSASSGLGFGGRGRGEDAAGVAAPAAVPPAESWLQHQIYTALSVLTAVLDLLPREFIPRVFLHGLPPSASPLQPASRHQPINQLVTSPSTSPSVTVTSPSTPPDTPHAAAGGDALPGLGVPRSPSGPAAGSGLAAGASTCAGVSPLLSCLLNPSAFRVAPGSLTILAGLSLRAFVRLARPENLAWVVLPHLMPLLANAAPRRRAAYRANGALDRDDVSASHDQGPLVAAAAAAHVPYGGGGGDTAGGFHRSRSSPSGPEGLGTGCDGACGGGGRGLCRGLGLESGVELGDDEDGYWELVHCVYSQLVESSGLLTVRNLLPGWQAVEAGLAARLGWSPAAAEAWGAAIEGRNSAGSAGSGAAACSLDAAQTAAASAVPIGGGASQRSLSSLELQVRREIASKQQQVAALHGTHLFIKEVGWSAPSALPASGRSAPRDVPYNGVGAAGAAAGSGSGGTSAAAAASGPSAVANGQQHHRGGLVALGSGGGGLNAGTFLSAIGGLGGGGSAVSAAADGDTDAFIWPQLLAIGSPTVAEGLAVRGGATAGGAGGLGLLRQTSGGSSHGGIADSARRVGGGGNGSSGGAGGGGVRAAAEGADAAEAPPPPERDRSDPRKCGVAVTVGVSSTTLAASTSVTVGVLERAASGGALLPSCGIRHGHELAENSSTVANSSYPSGSPSPSPSPSPGPGPGPGPGPQVQGPNLGNSPGDGGAASAAVAMAGVGVSALNAADCQGAAQQRPTSSGPATVFADRAAAAVAADAANGDDDGVGPRTGAWTAAGGDAEEHHTAPAAGTIGTGAVSSAMDRQRPPSVHPAIRLQPARSDPGPAAGERSAAAVTPELRPASTHQQGHGGGGDGGSGVGKAGPTPGPAAAPSTAPAHFASNEAAAPSPAPNPEQPHVPSRSSSQQQQQQQQQQQGHPAKAAVRSSSAADDALQRQASRRAGSGPALAPLLIPPPVLSDGQTPDPGGHRWSWLPPVFLDIPNPAAAAGLPPPPPSGSAAGLYGSTGTGIRAARARFLAAASAPPTSEVWGLQASVVHSWPAHRDRIRVLAVHPGECTVLTAGRGAVGGREGPVVRIWSLSDCQARVQYGGHRTAVQSLLLLRAARAGGAVVASLDAAGQLHVWSYDSGQLLARFAAASGTSAAGFGAVGSGAGGGTGTGSGGGGSSGSVTAESDATEANGGSWGDLIDRSGHYLLNQPPEAVGWQAMGGLKTSRQLSAATAAALPHTSAAAIGGPNSKGVLAAVGGGGVGQTGPGASIAAGVASGAVASSSAAVAVAAVAPALGPMSQPVGGGGVARLGYTIMCTSPDEHRLLYAGTADARLCMLDLERQRVVAEWVTASVVRQDAEDAVTALCVPGGSSASGGGGEGFGSAHSAASSFACPWLVPEVVAVGSRGGRVVLLDRRCGTAAMAFRAHGGEVSSMASYGSHVLVSAGADKVLRLWDLRRCAASGPTMLGGSGSAGPCGAAAGYDSRTGPWAGWDGPRGGAGGGGEALWGIVDAMSPVAVGAVAYATEGPYGSGIGALEMAQPPTTSASGVYSQSMHLLGGVAAPALLRSFPLPREGVQSLRVLRDCLLMTSGSSIGVLALAMALAVEVAGSAGASPSSAALAGGIGGGGVTGPSFARLRNGRGGRESAAITGLAVLPCCRLLAVAGEDGAVRICR